MKPTPQNPAPQDAQARKAIKPVVCYPIDTLPAFDSSIYEEAKASMELVDSVLVAPRDAETFRVPAGHFFRITCPEGPQVGDLNLWNAHDLNARFFSALATGFGVICPTCARWQLLHMIRLIGMAGMNLEALCMMSSAHGAILIQAWFYLVMNITTVATRT